MHILERMAIERLLQEYERVTPKINQGIVNGVLSILSKKEGRMRINAALYHEMVGMLLDNRDAWNGEEESVRFEHQQLIFRLKNLLNKIDKIHTPGVK